MSNTQVISVFIIMLLRYLLIAGAAFLIFYILYPKRFYVKKIQKQFPKNKDYFREIIYSLFTVIIFAGITFILYSPLVKPHTKIYTKISDHGILYFVLSVFLALIIHDTYFYWTHRLMHHPTLFKLFHLTHHRSVNPSPWAAYAFNPLEAIVEAGVIFVITFIIPINSIALLIFLLVMIIYNVYGHLGYEIYPHRVVKSKLGKWLNTSTNHNMHHKYFNGNYGLYFRYWDEIMKTTHPDYEDTLNQITAKSITSATKKREVHPV